MSGFKMCWCRAGAGGHVMSSTTLDLTWAGCRKVSRKSCLRKLLTASWLWERWARSTIYCHGLPLWPSSSGMMAARSFDSVIFVLYFGSLQASCSSSTAARFLLGLYTYPSIDLGFDHFIDCAVPGFAWLGQAWQRQTGPNLPGPGLP